MVTIRMSSTQQPIKTESLPIVTPPLKAKRGKKKAKKIPVQPLEEVVQTDIPCRGCGSVMVDPLDYGYGFCSRACAYGDQQDYY
jgi:hypothetical protein